MKKICLLLALLFVGCTETKQQKAESVVRLYLDKMLNDPHSYEQVQFSKIDSAFTTYEDDAEYISANAKEDSVKSVFSDWKLQNPKFEGMGDLSSSEVQYFTKMSKYYSDNMLKYGNVAVAIMKNYKPKFKGWKIAHTYRAKNGFGALTLHQTDFEIDSALTTVSKIHESE